MGPNNIKWYLYVTLKMWIFIWASLYFLYYTENTNEDNLNKGLG